MQFSKASKNTFYEMMMPKRPDGLMRAFGMSGLQMVSDLRVVEKEYAIDLGFAPKTAEKRKSSQYEQFEADLRAEAARMSEFYEVFYCLENSIRRLVKDLLVEAEGLAWWDSNRVHEDEIRRPCEGRRKKEVDSGVTPRSDDLIDYTSFGELALLERFRF